MLHCTKTVVSHMTARFFPCLCPSCSADGVGVMHGPSDKQAKSGLYSVHAQSKYCFYVWHHIIAAQLYSYPRQLNTTPILWVHVPRMGGALQYKMGIDIRLGLPNPGAFGESEEKKKVGVSGKNKSK